MKKVPLVALAALVLASSSVTVQAAGPVRPVPGAVCNLYLMDVVSKTVAFTNVTETLAEAPAAATFVDDAEAFAPSKKQEGVLSSWGMWTGWMKVSAAGTYTFLCQREYYANASPSCYTLYSVWINGEPCLEGVGGQSSFDVVLQPGFNSVKIIAESAHESKFPLVLSYKKKGSVKDPTPFGPVNMFYEDED